MAELPETALDRVFAVLADPTRRAIVTRLLAGDASVSDLAAPFDMTLPAVSKHIAHLVDAGLITQTRIGRSRICRLDPDALRPAALWIESLGLIAPIDFDELEGHLVDLGLTPPVDD